MRTEQLAGIWYASLYEVKRKHRMAYVLDGNSVSDLYAERTGSDLLNRYFTKEEQRMILREDREERVKKMAAGMEQKKIRFCSCDMPEYPASLKNIPDPPYGLYYLGGLPENDRFCVGIVGARMCTEYGRKIATELGKRLGAAGICVISGMAAGVDSASHAGTLMADGETYAVLGCGCDICYPSSSKNLYRQIPDAGGVISEYMPQTRPLPVFFPERNRIISGLSDVLVVVEAREKSGSLITVDCALDQGRDIYAVPGRIGDQTSRGCHRLIDQGASILYDLNRFTEEMQQKAAMKNKWTTKRLTDESVLPQKMTLEKDEQLVYSCLDLHPKNVFLLLEETGLALDILLSVLSHLSDLGLAEEVQRNAYIKTFVEF
ncbi:MAG: DNA-protecting protein DprA [Lachnospiraceae bacterium]|nr:DNA-protecting protein DprA [Lachnospiraceae bacterium]